MPAIIVLAVITIVAMTVLSFAVHFLSPRLLMAIAILAWMKVPAAPLPPVTSWADGFPAPRRGQRGWQGSCVGGERRCSSGHQARTCRRPGRVHVSA